MSSSSNRRSSAIDRSLYPGMRATSPAQRAQLAFDLGVERRLPAGLATGRLGLEHLADLLAGLGAVWRRGGRLALHDQVAVPDAPVDPPAAPVGDGGQQH